MCLSVLGFCTPKETNILKVENKREFKLNLVRSLVELILLQRELKSTPSTQIDKMSDRDATLLTQVVYNERTILNRECKIFSPKIELFLKPLPVSKLPTNEDMENELKAGMAKQCEMEKTLEEIMNKVRELSMKETRTEFNRTQTSAAQIQEECIQLKDALRSLFATLIQLLDEFHFFYRTEVLIWSRTKSSSSPLLGIGPTSRQVYRLHQQLQSLLQRFEELWTSYTNFIQLMSESAHDSNTSETIIDNSQILQMKQNIDQLSLVFKTQII
jgi:hypothetical protein